MEKHIQFLNMYTVGTKSNDINTNKSRILLVWGVDYCSGLLVSIKVPVKVRFTEPRFTRSYQPKSYYQSRVHRKPVYVWFGLVHLPSHIPHSLFHSITFLFPFAFFQYPSVHYGHICPPPVSSILVYMSYATLPHTYGLLSPSHFPI